MAKEVIFEELGKKEKIILLEAFDYDVDPSGFILNAAREKIPSKEIPNQHLNIENVALVPGTLNVIDGTPSSISKFIREIDEKNDVCSSLGILTLNGHLHKL